jgi:hypothetical protein
MVQGIEFWKELCPTLSVTEKEVWTTPTEVNIQNIKHEIDTNGYFHVPFDSWDLPIEEMAGCIDKLKSLGIPPVWCFVYNEFWLLTARIDTYIKSVLGEKYHKLPEMWAWHVDPAKKERGWKIHRDRGTDTRLYKDGSPKSISIWIPLTDTDVENGCMHVLPIKDDKDYYDQEYFDEGYDPDKVIALPAKAGDVLGWTQNLLHWGGETTNTDAKPRISVSVEFVADYAGRLRGGSYRKPWMSPFYIPDFERKTKIIQTQIEQYEHMWNSK